LDGSFETWIWAINLLKILKEEVCETGIKYYPTGLTGFTCTFLRLQKTLRNLDPLPAETKAFVSRTIRFVPFFRKGTKIQLIL